MEQLLQFIRTTNTHFILILSLGEGSCSWLGCLGVGIYRVWLFKMYFCLAIPCILICKDKEIHTSDKNYAQSITRLSIHISPEIYSIQCLLEIEINIW